MKYFCIPLKDEINWFDAFYFKTVENSEKSQKQST